jgi:ubiquinone/menaquinone biosynthesis C-methylase UbiE
MLIDAQRRATAAQLAITYVRADARALPLATASVDCTLIGGSLNEMEDLPRIWAEVTRISTPAATFYSMHLLRTGAHSPRVLGLGGITLFGADDIPTALSHAGWSLTDRQQTGIVQTIRALRRS